MNRKYGHTVLVMWLVLAGLMLGFATDFVIRAPASEHGEVGADVACVRVEAASSQPRELIRDA